MEDEPTSSVITAFLTPCLGSFDESEHMRAGLGSKELRRLFAENNFAWLPAHIFKEFDAETKAMIHELDKEEAMLLHILLTSK